MCAAIVTDQSTNRSPNLMIPSWKDLKFWKSTMWRKISILIQQNKDHITPPPELIFRPLLETPLDKVKVFMLFDEPYFNPGVANGLALSFYPTGMFERGGFDFSPMIFHRVLSEYSADLNVPPPKTGDLSKWAKRGVLLWNARPTTLKNHTMGHLSWGWPTLTREMIETVYLVNPKAVFVFFGTYHELYKDILPEDANKMIFEPFSPIQDNISGSRLFSQINVMLRNQKQKKINWLLD